MKRSFESGTKAKSSDDQRSQQSRLSEEQAPEKLTKEWATGLQEERTEDFVRASLNTGGEPGTQRVGSSSLDKQVAVLTSVQPDFRRSLVDLESGDFASQTPPSLSTRPDFRSSLVGSPDFTQPTTSLSRIRQPHPFDRSLPEPIIASSSRQRDTPLYNLDPPYSQSMPTLPFHQRHLLDRPSDEGEERVEIHTSQDAGDTNPQDRHFEIYTERVIREVKIPDEYSDIAKVHLRILYEMLKKSKTATSEDDYNAACRNVLAHAPKEVALYRRKPGRTTGEWFNQFIWEGGESTRLETNNIRARGELEVERRAREGKPTSKARRAKNETVWRLNKPKYRLALASTLGIISTLTPIAYDGGKVKPSDAIAAPINVAATYADTAIFKAFDYPVNLGITTLVWQGSSFVTSFAQKGIDKIGHHDITNNELASRLAEPFGNLAIGNSTIEQILAGRLDALTKEGLTFAWSK